MCVWQPSNIVGLCVVSLVVNLHSYISVSLRYLETCPLFSNRILWDNDPSTCQMFFHVGCSKVHRLSIYFFHVSPSLGPTNENLPFTTGADQVFKRRCVATIADAPSFVAVGEPMEQGGLCQLSKEIDGTDAIMWRETDGFLTGIFERPQIGDIYMEMVSSLNEFFESRCFRFICHRTWSSNFNLGHFVLLSFEWKKPLDSGVRRCTWWVGITGEDIESEKNAKNAGWWMMILI